MQDKQLNHPLIGNKTLVSAGASSVLLSLTQTTFVGLAGADKDEAVNLLCSVGRYGLLEKNQTLMLEGFVDVALSFVCM